MKDEPIDIIPFIALLAVVVSLAINIVLPDYRKSFLLRYDEIADKTVSIMEGTNYYVENLGYSGNTYSETILYLDNQNYFMPEPRLIDIGGTILSIEDVPVELEPGDIDLRVGSESYVPDNSGTAYLCKEALYNWCNQFTARHGQDGKYLRFAFRYTPGETESLGDDRYALYVVSLRN